MKKLFTLTLAILASFSLWAESVTISPDKNATSSYYFAADGTVITNIAGSGGSATSWNSGTPKITVQGKTENSKNVATFTFTIGSGVTITSFTANGSGNNNTNYALDGTAVTLGTALTSLSKTGSMSFTLTCKDASSSSSNRNTTFSSFVLSYTAEDKTAPTLSSSTPASGATSAATSGTIVLTFNEAIASIDGSKFTLTNATKGTVAIDGTDAKKVNVPYSDAEELTVVTLAVAADAVADAAGNKSAALTDISFTTAGTCTNPVITTDLSTTMVEYDKDATATALSIVATGKSLTYQWYSNTSNSTEGATSLGASAQTASYTPSTATLGTVYYFCIVSSGTCSTTSAITPVKVNYPRATGWVIYDGMTDESFANGSIEYNSVTVTYTVVGNTMLGESDIAKRNKDNQFNDLTYPNAVKMNMNDGADASTTGYLSFTVPTGYQLTKIIFAVAYAGGNRNVVLATSAVTSTTSEDVIASLHTGGNSEKIFDATYQPTTALPAGTYYMCSPVGGSWNIFHLQLVLETTPSTALDENEAEVKAVKVLRNGQLFIEKNGVIYNAMGQVVK